MLPESCCHPFATRSLLRRSKVFIAVVPAPTSSLRQERNVFCNSARHMALLRSARFLTSQSYKHFAPPEQRTCGKREPRFRCQHKNFPAHLLKSINASNASSSSCLAFALAER